MKYPFLLFYFFLSLSAIAQVSWQTGRTHDFGEIPEGKEVKHTFSFKNEGKAPLTIETTRTTCGCTAVAFDQTPIQPGETGSLVVTFDGQVPIGNRFKKKIKVYFKERKKGETLTIRGEVQ
jgi:hypothetical protein